MTRYDVIGDVHGHARALTALLRKLGYREHRGAWRHPERTAVFVGDLIDRGPEQLETVRIARCMVEAGAARIVMGNHEFNAIAWTTPDGDGGWCRSHSDKHLRQHEQFLAAVIDGSPRHEELIDWFRTMPLWLDLGALRVVHACWHPESMVTLGDGRLTDQHVSAEQGSDVYGAIEIVLKGPEIAMAGHVYRDKDGNSRDKARYRWWRQDATTMRGGADIPPGATTDGVTPFPTLPEDPVPEGLPTAPAGVPVLYGHYWRPGDASAPHVDDRGNSACLDWSVAAGGPLVAYCWEGESTLVSEHLVAVRP